MWTRWCKNIWVKRIVFIVLAYVCVLSLSKVISLHGDPTIFWGGEYFSFNIISVITFGCTIWLLNRFIQMQSIRQKCFSGIGGLLLSAAIVYGAYAHYVNDIYLSAGESFLQCGMILGIGMLTIPLCSELFTWFQKCSIWFEKHLANREPLTPKKRILYYLMIWMGIFLCYIPLFLAWWPGNFVFDACYQIRNVVEGYLSTHHPLAHTLLMGNAYMFGKSVGDVSWGYQFYTLFQMLVLSSSFAYVVMYLYKRNAPKSICVGTALWFALFPMHAVFSISSTKDVLCAAFFLYFLVFLVRLIYDKEQFKWYSYVGMIINGILLSLFRNNALYAVILTGVIIFICTKGWKKKGKIFALFLAITIGAKLSNEGLILMTDASEPDTYKEMMSVPLQCLARVASYRYDDMPQEYYEELLLYTSEENIKGYNPYLSDAVKNTSNEELFRTNLLNFLKLWAKVGLEFPDEYIESFVTNTMGYWYPLNQGHYVSADVALYHTLIGVGDEIEKTSYCDWAFELYKYFFWAQNYRSTPLLGFFFRNAPYVWFVTFYMIWCFMKKHYKSAIIGALPLAYLFTCYLGPMAALRYVYSIIVCTPILLYLIMRKEVD